METDVNVYGNPWPLILSHAKACAVYDEKECHVSKGNLNSLNEPHSSLTILKTMVFTRGTDDDFTHKGEIELQDLTSSHQMPTVPVPDTNPGSKTVSNTSIPTYTAHRPASTTWAGPTERFEGKGRNAVYLRAVRTVLQHLDEQGWEGGSKLTPADSQTGRTRSWLVAATQSVPGISLRSAGTPYSTRYNIPRDVSNHSTALRTNSRNTEVEKASGLILETLREERKREAEETRVKQAQDMTLEADAKLLGYWS